MLTDTVFQIHLDQILKEKAPQLARKIPGFLMKFPAKIVHQNDINEALRFIGNDTGVDAMQKLTEYFKLTIRLEGEENLPPEGKYIFVSNHPLGGMDGICLSAVLGRKYNKKIKYLVNDILYFLKPLRPIFIPVNKHGAQSKKSAALIREAGMSDNQLITFPAGLCSRKQHGKIEDLAWKKMFILKAIEYRRDIVPVYFEGRNSRFFYWLADTRVKLGIKTNIEMLFLPAEVFKQRGATFTIHFGKPIAWQTLDASKTPQEWANEMKKKAYQLGIKTATPSSPSQEEDRKKAS
ncbi:MAG: 1-acyl-sn-glycerol-3-phosphate acyltransferase [Dysgonamonadaceae bacterium]|jgi:putative hemolysin|nr:1-acyl-sn-glycerol-3-phosphate acyltransferase [Dysgonamonadaceae bacterium]